MPDENPWKARTALLAARAMRELDEPEPSTNDDQPLEVPLSLRITYRLRCQLREQAAAEQIQVSALVRRILTRAMTGREASAHTRATERAAGAPTVSERGPRILTGDDVERIAARVALEIISQ